MLVTPLLSASPLAVPPLAQYDHKYSIEDHIDNIPKNLKALPNIRNWSEKPPDLKALNQIRQQQQPQVGKKQHIKTPILSISTYNSNEHAKEYSWSTTSNNNQNLANNDRFPVTNNIRYHNRTSINQYTRNYFFNLSATESSTYKLTTTSGNSSSSSSNSASSSSYSQTKVDDQKNTNKFHNYHNNLKNNNTSVNSNLNSNNNQTNSIINGTSISKKTGANESNPSLRREYKNEKIITIDQNVNKGYISNKDTIFYKYGYFIIIVITLSIIGVSVFLTLAGLRYFRTVRGATRALALPLPLLPDDRTPLNAEPEHPVPMLSVQSPGCAGMERLGVPARSSPPMRDERSHMSSRRLRADTQTFQTHHQDLISRDGTILSERQLSKSADSSLHHSHHYNNHNSRNIISCPHHVALPDGEWGPDRDLHNRQFCQQSEIPRTYVKAPPNKTVRDVPGQPYLLTSSSCNLSQRSNNSDGSGVGGRGSSIASSMTSNNHHHHVQQLLQQQQQQQQQAKNEKSKASFVAKLFFRGGGTGSSSNNNNNNNSNSSTNGGSLCSNNSKPIDNNLNPIKINNSSNLSTTHPTPNNPMSSTTSLTSMATTTNDTTINYTSFGGSTNSSISITTSPLSQQLVLPMQSSSPLTTSISSTSLTNSTSGPSPETNAHYI